MARRRGIDLQDIIQPVAEVTSRRRLRSASSSALVVPATRRHRLETERLRLLDHVHGTVYMYLSSSPIVHFSPSRNILRLLFRARIRLLTV